MASIRSKGKINKWVDDKGFGFITPEKGSKSIFVHISAFDRNIPRRPKVGDVIFYHVKTDQKEKTKAVDASIEGVAPVSKKSYSPRPKKQFRERSSRSSWKLLVLLTILVIAGGTTIYDKFLSNNGRSIPKTSKAFNMFKSSQSTKQSSSRYTCAGKTRCNQMTSCEEAKFYIRNCPNTKMDGNRDGVPCERQWCN